MSDIPPNTLQPCTKYGTLLQPPATLTTFSLVRADGVNATLPQFSNGKQTADARDVNIFCVDRVSMNVGGAVLFDSSGAAIPQTTYLLTPKDVTPPPPNPKDRLDLSGRPAIVPYNAGWRNYYHFLIQSCFSAWLFRNYYNCIDGVYILPPLREGQKNLLHYAKLDQNDCHFYHKHKNLTLENVYFSDLPYSDFVYEPSTLLRPYADSLMRAAGAEVRSTGIKLYISRRDSPQRPMLNELELETLLSQKGYQIAQLSKLSLVEQMSLLHQADVIIAPHGAGLSNLIFCRPGTKIIELSGDTYINSCFVRISQVLGFDHTLALFSAKGEIGGAPRSWRVDLDLLGSIAP